MRYIEPCCVHNQLPELVNDCKTHYFWTSGDVTFENLLRNMSGNMRGMCTVVIVKKELTVYDCRLLAWFMRHGDWWHGLVLVTDTDCAEMVGSELRGFEHLYYYKCVHGMHSEMIAEWNSDGENVVLMGSLPSSPAKSKDVQGYVVRRSADSSALHEALFAVWMQVHRGKTENEKIREFFNRNY